MQNELRCVMELAAVRSERDCRHYHRIYATTMNEVWFNSCSKYLYNVWCVISLFTVFEIIQIRYQIISIKIACILFYQNDYTIDNIVDIFIFSYPNLNLDINTYNNVLYNRDGPFRLLGAIPKIFLFWFIHFIHKRKTK